MTTEPFKLDIAVSFIDVNIDDKTKKMYLLILKRDMVRKKK